MPRLILLALLTATAAAAQTPTPIPSLDLHALAGTWFEVARLPTRHEKKCTDGALVLYALGDKPGHLQVVTSCQVKGNFTTILNADGKSATKFHKHQPAPAIDGKLKITYTFPFTSKLWVLALTPDYALIGSPNHKTLSILSKTPTLPPATLTQLEQTAAAEGFNQSNLQQVLTPHQNNARLPTQTTTAAQ